MPFILLILLNSREWGIIPVFVFQGLNILKKDKPFRGGEDSRSNKRNAFWDAYEKGQLTDSKAISLGKLHLIAFRYIANF